MSQSWDLKYLRLALHVAGWSKDNSTKVGAVIVGPTNEVISLGFNGPPRGVNDDDPERWVRPEKYRWCEHAERNAIFNAARMGVSTMASTMYMTSTPAKFAPCDECARAIIQAGIARLVVEPPSGDIERWKDSFVVSSTMLAEAGVEVAQLCVHSETVAITDNTHVCKTCNKKV